MEKQVLISICIPAYKRVDFLKRLLDSISIQSFRDYEVVISDDSPGEEVKEMICGYTDRLSSIVYKRNTPSLGMPSNWNQSIRMAKGEWIKLMHDDDWFNGPDALQQYASAAQNNPGGAFIFAAYHDVLFAKGEERKVSPPAFRLKELKKEPVTLLSTNIVGPPSVVMHRNDDKHFYDEKLKWLVDIDMYIRRLKDDPVIYIDQSLVKVGVGDDQVTASVHGFPEVEIPEHFYFLGKTGVGRLRNILVYDYWWRFIRNFALFTPEKVKEYGYAGEIHPVLQKMMAWQKRIPVAIVKNGLFSKLLMTLHFILYSKGLPNG
jgi:glycosyltransferase involved in cell wall biosynthesis